MIIKNPTYNPNDVNSQRWIEDTKPVSNPTDVFKNIGNMFTSFLSKPANITTDTSKPVIFPSLTQNNLQTKTPFIAPLASNVSNAPITTPVVQNFNTIKTATPDPTVLAQQKALNAKGANLVEDGIMGAKTRNALVQFGGNAGTGNLNLSAGMTPEQIASEAGKAGLSATEYQALIDQYNAPDTTAIDKIRSDLGITTLEKSVFEKPAQTTQAIYQDYYNQSGLGDIKSKIATLDTELKTIRDGYTTAIKEHQDNPWLSASTRSARVAREKELYGQREANTISLRQSYLDQYDKGVDEIEKAVGRVSTDLETNRTLDTNKLNYLLTEAERRAGQLVTDAKKQNIRYSGTYLKSRYGEKLSEENRKFAQEKEMQRIKDGAGNKTTANLILQNLGIDTTKDPVFGDLANSAGGKATTDTFRTSFEKSVNTLYQLSDLDKSFSEYKKNTGNTIDLSPITGIIKSANPYDTKSQLIKAQLTALVPNLARGIYGEVGVLTDQDIANYTKTLPNLKSTEDVRKALLGITAKSVERSMENKLRVQALGGVDVSGFIPMLNEIKQTTGKLLTSAGIQQATNSNAWIADFITNARASGKSDTEISAYLASKGVQ